MTLSTSLNQTQSLRRDVETLLHQHGLRSVLLAVSASVVGGRAQSLPDLAHLSPHLRRDIALAAHHERPTALERLR